MGVLEDGGLFVLIAPWQGVELPLCFPLGAVPVSEFGKEQVIVRCLQVGVPCLVPLMDCDRYRHCVRVAEACFPVCDR